MMEFEDLAKKIEAGYARKDDERLHIIGRWHSMMGWIRVAILESEEEPERKVRAESEIAYCLIDIAEGAAAMLQQLGVEGPTPSFIAEYERAAAKHPGMTLNSDRHTNESRFYALAEEIGEVCAALTYDNATATGHNSNLISEVTQVGGLAIAWLMRYQKEGGNDEWQRQNH